MTFLLRHGPSSQGCTGNCCRDVCGFVAAAVFYFYLFDLFIYLFILLAQGPVQAGRTTENMEAVTAVSDTRAMQFVCDIVCGTVCGTSIVYIYIVHRFKMQRYKVQ